jgi:hypothetical protein
MRRLELKQGDDAGRIEEEVILWRANVLDDINRHAPELADRLMAQIGTMPDNHKRKRVLSYMRRSNKALAAVGRDLFP